MSVSVIVPFNPGDQARDRNWKFVKARYKALYPDWQIVVRGCSPPWRKGLAVHAAVEASSGDMLVLSDADVLVAEHALRDAVERLQDHPWVIPHRMVYRLNEEVTRALVEDRIYADPRSLQTGIIRRPHKGPAGGGISVMRREDYETSGGIDPAFVDWGGEDISFARALDTLVGPHLRLDNIMWHLLHDPMPRIGRNRAFPENEALANRYLDASGDPAAMKDLLEQSNSRDKKPYEGFEGGGITVARREVIESTPVDCRFVGWG